MSATISLIIAATILAGASQAPQRPDSLIHHDPPPPPEDLQTFMQEADAVVSVRVSHRRAWPVEERFPFTEYTTTVVEVFKGHSRLAPAVGSELIFLEIAGEKQTARGLARTDKPATLKPGDTAVVFLWWTPGLENFQLRNGRHGIYMLDADRVRPVEPSKLGGRWQSASKETFLAELRKSRKH